MRLFQTMREPSLQRRWLFLFFGGMCIGVVCANLTGIRYQEQIHLLSDYLLQKYQASEIHHEELFWYCLRTRLFPMCYIILFGLTLFGCAAGYGYVLWTGFSSGFLLSIATMRFGAKGILLCVTGVLPQFLIYIPVMLGLLMLSSVVSMRLYGQGRNTQAASGERKKLLGLYLLLCIGFMLVCIIGVWVESYVNPIVLKKILKIF